MREEIQRRLRAHCHSERSEESGARPARQASKNVMRGRQPHQYYVYIMLNTRHTIYTGLTNDLYRRVWQHRNKITPGFTSKYDCTALVYYEVMENVRAAIAREKQIKAWTRAKMTALIRSLNPEWRDLSLGWKVPEADARVPDPSLRSG